MQCCPLQNNLFRVDNDLPSVLVHYESRFQNGSGRFRFVTIFYWSRLIDRVLREFRLRFVSLLLSALRVDGTEFIFPYDGFLLRVFGEVFNGVSAVWL